MSPCGEHPPGGFASRLRTSRFLFPRRITPDRIYSSRQGERSGQCRSASVAQAVVLFVWQEVQGFGSLYFSVIAGVMNANVCACTLTFAIVVSIAGIWQLTHSLAGVPSR